MNAADYEPLLSVIDSCTEEQRYVRAVLELTYRCNFKCPHCFVHTDVSNHGYRDKELTTHEWCGVLDQLADDGCLVVTFTGGEVLCRSDFATIATHARDRRFAVRIFTNASYIDESRADMLATIQPMQVEVSLYGATPESYRAVAGHEIYLEQACLGVDRLLARDIRVVLKAPLMQQNVQDMDALVALADQRWGQKIKLSVQLVQRDDRSEEPVEYALDSAQLARYYAKYGSQSRPMTRELSNAPCNVAKDYLVISPFGEVFPCVGVKRSVGNVRERPIREIWETSPFLGYLRQLTLADYTPHYTAEEFEHAMICPGEVFRETGHPVGPSRWKIFAHDVLKQCGTLSCEGCNC